MTLGCVILTVAAIACYVYALGRLRRADHLADALNDWQSDLTAAQLRVDALADHLGAGLPMDAVAAFNGGFDAGMQRGLDLQGEHPAGLRVSTGASA